MRLNSTQAQHAEAFGWSSEKTFSISITDVWISRDAQISIGRQLKALCISLDLPYSLLRESLVQELFWYESADSLGMMIEVQGSTVDSLYLQIPDGHWGFRDEDASTQ